MRLTQGYCEIILIANKPNSSCHRYLKNQTAQGILAGKKYTSTRASASSGHKTKHAGCQGKWANKAVGPGEYLCLL
jgi:hypothetical protein